MWSLANKKILKKEHYFEGEEEGIKQKSSETSPPPSVYHNKPVHCYSTSNILCFGVP